MIWLIILSLCSCAVGFLREIAEANIVHVEHGRAPNAGGALLFPTIALVQVFYFLAAWGLNHIGPDVGYAAVAVYACISMGVRFARYRKAAARLKALRAAVQGRAA